MKKFLKGWKWTLVFGLLILFFALGIRLYHLTLLPVFVDEAIYIRWSQVMNAEPTLRFLPLSDGKQPLFMWILMFIVNRLSDPLFAGRILSVASGIGTMIGIFAVSYLLFKNKLVSLVAAFTYSLSPFTFFFDRMALVDAMLAMFGIWILFFGVLTAKTKRLDMAIITGFCLGGALLTKSPAVFFTLLVPTTWLFIKNPKHLIKLMSLLLVTYIIGYGMYNVLRLGPNFNLVSSRNADYIFPISHLWSNWKDPFIFHIKEIFLDWFIKIGPWPILALTVIGLLTTAKKYRKESIVLCSWFIIPILIQSEFAKVFTARYILFTLPPVFIITGTVLLSKVRWLRVMGCGLLMFFMVLSLKFDYLLLTNPDRANLPSSERSGYLEEWTAGDGIKEISEYLKYQFSVTKNQKMVVGTEGYFGTLPDGLQMYLNKIPEITVIGVGIDIKEVPTSLQESVRAGSKTYLVINKSRFHGDSDTLGLKLIAAYPKALRREKHSREYIQKGPQEVLYLYEVTQKAI